MTEPRRAPRTTGHRRFGLLLIITGGALSALACGVQALPRAIGAGEIVVATFPSQTLTEDTPATFGLELNMPVGSYTVRLAVDGPGLEAEEGVRPDDADIVEVEVLADGTLIADGVERDENKIVIQAGLAADSGPAIGVARSWRIILDVSDPYTGSIERLVDEIFPYRVQWIR